MKAKTTRRTLLTSALALLLCVSMLAGSTFAWFTDEVTSQNNIIKSGNLDVELYYQADGQSGWTKVTSDTNVFKDDTLWEPGHTEVVKLKVVNEGTLALKYQLGVNVASETGSVNVDGKEFKLSDHIWFGIVEGDQTYTRDQAVAAVESTATALNTAYSSEETKLLPKTDANAENEDIVTLVVYMPTAVGNEANYGKDQAVPVINLGINLFATQFTYEKDSFDETYDDIHMASGYDALMAFKGADGNYLLTDDVEADSIIHFGSGTTSTVDLNGNTITAGNPNQFILGAQQGGVLVLNGEGTVDAGKGLYANKGDAEIVINGGTYNTTVTTTLNGMAFHSLAQNNSKIVVNGGVFTSNVDNAAIFMATSNARIEINGGFFENTADKTPDLLQIGTNKGNTNRIVITGGTFVNYNPLEDKMCYTGAWPEAGEAAFGGPWILIPGGYTVVSETQANGDIWYSVVPAV